MQSIEKALGIHKMKFTLALLALFAAICVLSVNAGTWQPLAMSQEMDLEFEPNDVADAELMDPEVFGIFSATWWAIKAALRGVKGFNCIIKWVVGIKASALQYNADLVGCGVEATKDVTNLINQNLLIANTTSSIIHLKSTICASTDDVQKPSITRSCTVKTLAQTFRLYLQIKKAIVLAKRIPKTGPNAITCVTDATNNLTNYYTQFPSNMKACSKLTSS